MADLVTLSPESLRKLADLLARDRHRPINSPRPVRGEEAKSGARTVRIARTTTNTDFPTYPPRPANTYVVEFGELEFTATPGLQSATFTAYDPPQTRVARIVETDDTGGSVYLEVGSIVAIELHHGRWHILAWDLFNEDHIMVGDVDECDPGGYSCGGAKTETLLFGMGLNVSVGECGSYPNTYVVSADGLDVVGSDCSEEETTTPDVWTLTFEAPLQVTGGEESECPGTARISLPSSLIGSDCLDVAYDAGNCQYRIDLPDGLIKAGAGIAVAAGACDYTISTTGVDTGIAEGTCISFDVDGDETTINNTLEIIGGSGVNVENLGCTKVISLTGDSSPQTAISYLCDVELSQTPISIACVSDGSGGYTFSVSGGEITITKKYGSLSLPAAIISDSSSECGGSGSGSGGGPDPDPNTDTYPVTVLSTDCDSTPRTVSFRLNSLPTGFDHYEILSYGTTSNAFIESTPACPTYCQTGTTYTTPLPDDPDGHYSVSWRFMNAAGDVLHIHSEIVQC